MAASVLNSTIVDSSSHIVGSMDNHRVASNAVMTQPCTLFHKMIQFPKERRPQGRDGHAMDWMCELDTEDQVRIVVLQSPNCLNRVLAS